MNSILLCVEKNKTPIHCENRAVVETLTYLKETNHSGLGTYLSMQEAKVLYPAKHASIQTNKTRNVYLHITAHLSVEGQQYFMLECSNFVNKSTCLD